MNQFINDMKNIFSRKSVWIAAIILVLFTVACTVYDPKLFYVGLSAMVLYLIAMLCYVHFEKATGRVHSENSFLSGITLEFIMGFSLPVVIVNEAGSILWYNKALIDHLAVTKPLYGKTLADWIDPALNGAKLFRVQKDVPIGIVYDGHSYDITCHRATLSGKQYCITVWQDTTEFNHLRSELEKKNVLVAFIVIDNFSDAIQSIQDKSRTASAVIGSLLDKWSAGLSGILREYDREKYILFFEKRYLDGMTKAKFDVLDQIRELTVDDLSVQFTASIGVANIEGTLAEKEAAARRALDLALQRGGDQAVVKTETATEYYGGKSKTVQKKTKIRSRVIANEFTALIKKAGNVIIMGHKYADHDSIASCVAAARLARSVGAEVHIVVNIHDYNLKPIFARMRGRTDYEDLFLDRAAAQDLIRSNTLLVVCDVNNPNHFEAPELYENASAFVVIDHHRKSGEYLNPPRIAYIEPAASSASEMMCEILEQAVEPGSLPQLEADLLFAGLLLDTKQFTRNTGVRTFGAALYLRSEGANPIEAQKLFRTNIQDFLRESKFESNVVIYKDRIAISVYDKDADAADKIAAAKAADRLLGVEGVAASFVLCDIDGVVHISARSDGTINVQLILEALNGGGHYDAAGAQVDNLSMNAVLGMLKEAIDKSI